MAEATKARWLIQGTGHWIMVVMAWFLTLLAGDRFMDAIRGEANWLSGIGAITLSVVAWVASLRAKRGQD